MEDPYCMMRKNTQHYWVKVVTTSIHSRNENTSCSSEQLHALQRALPLHLIQGLSHPATVICNYGLLAEFPSQSCNFLFFCGPFSDFQREKSVFCFTIQ